MNISLKQLESFIAIAETKSFTEASERLFLSQPSLSNQIRQLETMLDVKLFIRTTRLVELTEAGRIFLPSAERALHGLSTGINEIKDLAQGRAGKVTFASILTVGASIVPLVMRDFQKSNPKIVIEYIEESDEPIFQRVLSREIDFGIGAAPTNQQKIDFKPIYRDYLFFVCALDHPLAELKEVSWEQIVQNPFIAMKSGMSMRHLMEKGFALTDTPLNPIQTATYQSTILGMIACGIGVSVLPSSLKLMFNRNDVKIIPIKEPLFRNIGLITPSSSELSIAAQEFIKVFELVVSNNEQLLPKSH
ncbi:LysR family transcriptional regulator [Aliivibrio fischeri]|uniref:LysR family transcriptional regulator n=1 Tax=Aliivibrio fischeri TaxID=668 RepID=UPI0012DA6E10|nr:LysR family transcriptional regulator [Aliivibrio fischeri]MUK68924.1 LysR family transcriptional regulator [Aliivibrio fischeri]MUK73379.1 LysR family transcriptional regulator [Aliivibrio fischeri]